MLYSMPMASYTERRASESGFEAEQKAAELITEAKEHQIGRAKTPDGQRRVERGLDQFVSPYLIECLVVAEQLGSPDYYDSVVAPTKEYLHAESGITLCADERIISLAIATPRAEDILRRGGGIIETRIDTETGKIVLHDRDVEAAIKTKIQETKRNGDGFVLVEKIGAHIRQDAAEAGCGAVIRLLIKGKQRTIELGVKPDGGLTEYFKSMRDSFDAFGHTTAQLGGRAITIDMTHDATTQGLIFGLRNAHQQMTNGQVIYGDLPDLSPEQMGRLISGVRRAYESGQHPEALSANLQALVDSGQILMTEQLVPLFSERIKAHARKAFRTDHIDLANYRNFARNAEIIGLTAIELAGKEERREFPWIPEAVRKDLEPVALRNLAYTAIRNATYITLAGIEPGAHNDLDHRAMVTRIGPVGAVFNYAHPSLNQNSSTGALTESDLQNLDVLQGVADSTYTHMRVDRTRFAQVIIPTQRAYEGDRAYDGNLVEVTNSSNAEVIRDRYQDAIENGEITVVPVLHKAGTKEVTGTQR